MGFLISCFLKLGNKTQSKERAILFVISRNANNGKSHITWTTLWNLIARILSFLMEKSCVNKLIMNIK